MKKMKLAALFLSTSVALSGAAYAAGADAAAAAQNRDLEALKTLLKQRADVNTAQADGTTALMWAAHYNDAEAVNLLLKAGANAKAVNRYGSTALSEAVVAGSAATIEALLNAGADAKTITSQAGETVLMTAARAGNADAVRLLLAKGADVNVKETYKGQTALMWAASERHPEVVKLLMAAGADWKVRSVDRETRPPRLSAASSISPIARGGFTALLFAAREGDVESAKAMLDGGVDINYGDIDNTGALTVALMNKQFTFANYLIDRGANLNQIDAYGRTPVYAAVDIRNEDWSTLPNRKGEDTMSALDVLKIMVDKGANLNTPLTKPLPGRSGMDSGDTALNAGSTPLMRAARSGDSAAMRLLLSKGADPKLKTNDGNNIFLFAAGVGYRDKNTRGTEAEALEAVKVALESGFDLNEANPRGETALHGAAGRGADKIVQFLVDKGAKLNTKSRQNFSPLDYALGKNVVIQLPVPHDSTVALIKKLGGLEGKDVK
jgi:uncharacterized protein